VGGIVSVDSTSYYVVVTRLTCVMYVSTSSYETKDVFCLSLYVKSAIVGKNDNSLPLTETDIILLW
jgi:hypothetical protein